MSTSAQNSPKVPRKYRLPVAVCVAALLIVIAAFQWATGIGIVICVSIVPVLFLIVFIQLFGVRKFEAFAAWQKFTAVAALVLGFFCLYVLSVGPGVAILEAVSTDPTTYDAFWKFYEPVDWLYMNTFLEKPLDWYIDFWSNAQKAGLKG